MFKSISKQDGETVAATHGIKVTGAWSCYSLTIIPKKVLEPLLQHNIGDSVLHLTPRLTDSIWGCLYQG